jgi:hypothetical protein
MRRYPKQRRLADELARREAEDRLHSDIFIPDLKPVTNYYDELVQAKMEVCPPAQSDSDKVRKSTSIIGVLGKVKIVDGRKVHCYPGDGCQATIKAIRNLLLCKDCKKKENITVVNGTRLFKDRKNGGRWAPLKGKLPTVYSIPNAYPDDPMYMEDAMKQVAYTVHQRNKHNQKKKEVFLTASVQEKQKICDHNNKIHQ